MRKSPEADAYDRIRKSIEKEKLLPAGFDSLITKDLDNLLRAYFEYRPEDLGITITPLAGEGYTLAVTLDASRAKRIKLL